MIWDSKDEFDFKIFNSAQDLRHALKEKIDGGNSACMTAGYCWDWSEPEKDGTLVRDVVIGDFQYPWNAKPNAGKLAPNIPKSHFWAHDPNGIEQIGYIYTAQGFEFDYVGVIVGMDLTYNFDKQEWVGNKDKSKDAVVKRAKENFTNLIKKFLQSTSHTWNERLLCIFHG